MNHPPGKEKPPALPLIDEQRWSQLWASLTDSGAHHPDQPAPAVLQEVAQRYAPTAQHRLRLLRAELDAGRMAQAAQLAHAVKGNGSMVGAARVEELAGQLEQRLPQLPLVNAQVWQEVSQLEHACEQTAAELEARTSPPP